MQSNKIISQNDRNHHNNFASPQQSAADFNDEYVILLGKGSKKEPSASFYVRLSMEDDTLDTYITPLPAGMHNKNEILSYVTENEDNVGDKTQIVSLGQLNWVDGMPLASVSVVTTENGNEDSKTSEEVVY